MPVYTYRPIYLRITFQIFHTYSKSKKWSVHYLYCSYLSHSSELFMDKAQLLESEDVMGDVTYIEKRHLLSNSFSFRFSLSGYRWLVEHYSSCKVRLGFHSRHPSCHRPKVSYALQRIILLCIWWKFLHGSFWVAVPNANRHREKLAESFYQKDRDLKTIGFLSW